MSELVRLNKHLAHSLGISRREADNYISSGRVSINGKVANLGNVIQPDRDSVVVNQQTLTSAPKRYSYVLLNKPVGYICSRKQQGETPTIYALLPHHMQHLKVAGRLDKDSQGLVLLTDDGDKIFQLTHPKFGKQKVYTVGLNKPLAPADQKKVMSGVDLEDGISKFQVSKVQSKQPNRYKVIMAEGRNRQIRRTFKVLGYTVTYLERTALGTYKLDGITDGKYLQI